jgi:hypothetical protein
LIFSLLVGLSIVVLAHRLIPLELLMLSLPVRVSIVQNKLKENLDRRILTKIYFAAITKSIT